MRRWLRQPLLRRSLLAVWSRPLSFSASIRHYHRFYSSGSKPPAPLAESPLPIPKTSSDRYIIIFTCKICNLRSAKSFSKRSYHHGVVYVKCSGCENLHLISDQLGWFGETNENIEEILARKGENVVKAELGETISDDDIRVLSSLKNSKHFT